MAQDAPNPYWQIVQEPSDKQWYIRLVANNHYLMVWGRGYNTPENAKQAIEWVRVWASRADMPA